MSTLEEIKNNRIMQNHFMTYNLIELSMLEQDRAECRLTLREESTNPYGMLHGGALYTMADCATGSAAHSDGRTYVTQNSSMNFLANIKEGTAVASASVVHRGRKTCLVNVNITSEATGRLLATGSFTFFCTAKD
ncbi:PaaI family thioesterase [uncultured Oscillibacter sp.]|uniref:PaaI family thioesterase n=1 Tax=uncultured Oscillibacter sp. TaxID=876091 RepID=UPI0025EF9366|nr:PaaI family thioesterase [uncultured Oscillibacter sp.]